VGLLRVWSPARNDPSEGLLSYARTRPDAKLAEFHVGDAQALPYPDRSFDAATMALAIGFIPDPVKAVKEMMRIVGPGGWVAAHMWDLPGGAGRMNCSIMKTSTFPSSLG
jgi:ubiquinone/menaquinone biosynthesis C-methylase UbiE